MKHGYIWAETVVSVSTDRRHAFWPSYGTQGRAPSSDSLMFDELAERFDHTLHRARRRVSALEDAVDALKRGYGRARSADGVVDVVVDGHGLLVSLTLAETASRLPAERLSAVIVETVQAAARGASAQRHAVLGDVATDLGR
jgi:DNA-binding protein YbaB